MECMCAQTRLRFILSSERVFGNGVRTHVNSKGKIPATGKKISSEEDQTHDTASRTTASPTHYQRAIQAPGLLSLPKPRLPASVKSRWVVMWAVVGGDVGGDVGCGGW